MDGFYTDAELLEEQLKDALAFIQQVADGHRTPQDAVLWLKETAQANEKRIQEEKELQRKEREDDY